MTISKSAIVCLLIAFISVGVVVALNQYRPLNTVVLDTQSATYRDASQSIDVRVEDLLGYMTTDEKIGQLALVEKNHVTDKNDIARYGIGALLSGGGGHPEPNTAEAWLAMVNEYQREAQRSRLGIPLLYGVDAVHGHTNVPGATNFPHLIGLGATHDEDLVRRIAAITAKELAATGIHWNFSPSLDVVQDTRWGRTFETFGSNATMVRELGSAYVEGLQERTSTASPVLATAKHYLGTGAMVWGTSTNRDFKIDQGVTKESEATLRTVHLPPFEDAVTSGVASVMVGHTSWNGVEMAANKYLLTDVLKGELGFQGFVVSDWYGVYEIPGGQYRAIVEALNAGVDMVMLPFDYKPFIENTRHAIERGDVSAERLDDAVRRILTAKFNAGLFDDALLEYVDENQFGSQEHREVAREAVRKSLVLLKDRQEVLPLSKTTPRILVAGSSAHNIGRQSGGWTIEWQGVDGNWIPGMTILDAIKDTVSKETRVDHDELADFALDGSLADVGIAVVGEKPYAEGWGDNEHPTLSTEDLETITKLRTVSKKLVVIIVAGRPLDIQPYVANWDAVVAAWLPGSEGMGVTDVLFGDESFVGALPVPWPL